MRKAPIASQKALTTSYSSKTRSYYQVLLSLLYNCYKCQALFTLWIKLFNHLDYCLYSGMDEEPLPIAQSTLVDLASIKPTQEKPSNAPLLSIGTRMGYCSFIYTIAPIHLSKTAKVEPYCFDTSYLAFIINRQFLIAQDPTIEIRLIASPLKISGIVGNQHTLSKYVITTLQILRKDKDGPIEAIITCKLHIVDNLDAKILIGTDIILPKKMDILLLDKTLQISTYNINVLV